MQCVPHGTAFVQWQIHRYLLLCAHPYVCPQKSALVTSYHAVSRSSDCEAAVRLSPLLPRFISGTAEVPGSNVGPASSLLFSSLLFSFVVFHRHSPSLFNSVQSAQLIQLSLILFINMSSTSWYFYSGAFAGTVAPSYPSVRPSVCAKQRASNLMTFSTVSH